MLLVEDDHVVETLTSNGADHPFDKWILPRGARCGKASCPKTQTNSRLARRAVSIVIAPWRAPDLGRVGGDVGDSASPHAQRKHRPATGCHAPGRRPGSRPGPHLDQNVLGQLRRGNLSLDSEPLGRPLFRCPQGLRSEPAPLVGANVALENRD